MPQGKVEITNSVRNLCGNTLNPLLLCIIEVKPQCADRNGIGTLCRGGSEK